MGTVTCIIIEDEFPAREILKSYLAEIADWTVKAEFTNAIEAATWLAKNPVDVIFLDIRLPKLSGISFLKSLAHPPLIVMTTAYSEHAVEAFELTVFDYLLKPYPLGRFLKTINRINSHLQDNLPAPPTEEQYYLLVRENRENIKVPVAEILYVESQKEYALIVCEARTIKVRSGISKLEEELPEGEFLRVHRSFLVALDKIDSFTSKSVTVGGKSIPIGRLYQKEVGRRLK
jgi:DNA-binding LytR/AlgR family response regulator